MAAYHHGLRRVYPRVGGETKRIIGVTLYIYGLSPRGRGNHPPAYDACRYCGSIPAWAGKPYGQGGFDDCLRVYPRVGGETDRDVGNDVVH